MGKSSNSLIKGSKLERKGAKRKTSSDLPLFKVKDKLGSKTVPKT